MKKEEIGFNLRVRFCAVLTDFRFRSHQTTLVDVAEHFDLLIVDEFLYG